MAKEWFTINELRAAKGANFSTQALRELAHLFQSLPKDKVRVRPGASDATHEAEFHISLFARPERKAIEAAYGPGSDYERIARLGICRPVADQRSVYVSNASEADIRQFEEMWRNHCARIMPRLSLVE
jgi:hypothetical protein